MARRRVCTTYETISASVFPFITGSRREYFCSRFLGPGFQNCYEYSRSDIRNYYCSASLSRTPPVGKRVIAMQTRGGLSGVRCYICRKLNTARMIAPARPQLQQDKGEEGSPDAAEDAKLSRNLTTHHSDDECMTQKKPANNGNTNIAIDFQQRQCTAPGGSSFQGGYVFLATTTTQNAKPICKTPESDNEDKQPYTTRTPVSEKDLNGPSVASLGLFGQTPADRNGMRRGGGWQ